ncbi:MAG: hypothetical protein PHE55_10220 [Methylococcaceae bacterium]|nr:hypothetical protein [Methylococcaceae bacterium]
MHRHRPPRGKAPSIPPATPGWPDAAHGFIHWVRQSCLVFGRDRREPTAGRPALTITQRDGAWVVLPSTTKSNANNPEFFYIPADSPDCLLNSPRERCDQYFYQRYECIDLSSCGARKYGILQQRLRLAVMKWLRERLSVGGAV